MNDMEKTCVKISLDCNRHCNVIVICRVTDCSPHLDGNREWAQQAQYNKFVREWVEELGQQIFATVLGVGYLAEEAKTHE